MNISKDDYKTLSDCISSQYIEVIEKIQNFNPYEVEKYSSLVFKKENLEVMINILNDIKKENGSRVMKKCIYLDASNNEIEADFYGIFQRSEICRPEPVIFGHQGGMKAWTVAVIYDEKGVHYIDPLLIKKIYEVKR
jgi:hypothetical protein